MDPHYKIYLDSIYKCEPSPFSRKTNCGRPHYQDRNGPAHVRYENEEESPCATNPKKRKVNNDWNDLLNDSELHENYRNFLKCLRYPSNEEGVTTFRFNNDVSFKCERGRRKEPIIEEQEEDNGADISDDDEGNNDDETGNEENMDSDYDDDDDDDKDTDIDDSDNVEPIDVDDDSDVGREDNIDLDDENEEKQEDTDISSDVGNEDGIDVEEETDIDNEDDADENNVTEEEEDDDGDDDEEGEDEAYSCTEKSSRVSISFTEYNSFEARLKKETKRPFNKYEYDRLMRQAAERKAINNDRKLRNGDKTYQTNVVGKSYFDHFPDLKAKVLAANKSKALKLLRGFFFWLKNLCHEGSYQPWVCQPRVKRKLPRYK